MSIEGRKKKRNLFVVFSSPVQRTESNSLERYPRRERQRENVKVFDASYLEACHSFNMCTRMLIFGMVVPLGYIIVVVKLK